MALADAGMDVNACSEEGERVLNWCMINEKSSGPEEDMCVHFLVSRGAVLGPGYGNYPARLEPYQGKPFVRPAKEGDGPCVVS